MVDAPTARFASQGTNDGVSITRHMSGRYHALRKWTAADWLGTPRPVTSPETAMTGHPFAMVPLPAERSGSKPRTKGLTMMKDSGLPRDDVRGLLDLIAPFVDYAKFVVGTARLYPEDHLLDKLAIYREFDVHTFIGGQFLEYVFATQGFPGVRPYCAEARRLGFEAIEVSDNRVPLTDAERARLISTAIDCGLEVHGEVGSKDVHTTAATLIRQAEICFGAGSKLVLVEGAELIEDNALNVPLLEELKAGLDVAKVMFELSGPWIPGTTMAEVFQLRNFLIDAFGPDVNIANVMPEHVVETEALRVGLGSAGPPSGG